MGSASFLAVSLSRDKVQLKGTPGDFSSHGHVDKLALDVSQALVTNAIPIKGLSKEAVAFLRNLEVASEGIAWGSFSAVGPTSLLIRCGRQHRKIFGRMNFRVTGDSTISPALGYNPDILHCINCKFAKMMRVEAIDAQLQLVVGQPINAGRFPAETGQILSGQREDQHQAGN